MSKSISRMSGVFLHVSFTAAAPGNSNHRHDEPTVRKLVLGFGAAGPSITFCTPEKESMRQTVNAWILSSEEFDGVVDLDAVLRDPSHPRDCSGIRVIHRVPTELARFNSFRLVELCVIWANS